MTFSFWDDPFFCHELLTLSASFTESTVSNMNRFGTAGEKTQAEGILLARDCLYLQQAFVSSWLLFQRITEHPELEGTPRDN